jgi:hypothetical protein
MKKPKLSPTELDMFAGALSVAVDLAMSPNEQHKQLGAIIAGLCAIINKIADLPADPFVLDELKAFSS